MTLLTLTDLACDRGGLVVLEGLDLTLDQGQAMILRGPNGSGKTTLLRTIAGLQPPVAGQITSDPDSIAYAAHSDGLKATLSVAENLEFWASLFGTSNIDRALTAYDLTELKSRRAQALSAGQKRRLGLARLLVTGRPIWILDEPTVSLDQSATTLFSECVRKHLFDGGAALIATHIDLGIDAPVLNVGDYKLQAAKTRAFDEAFL